MLVRRNSYLEFAAVFLFRNSFRYHFTISRHILDHLTDNLNDAIEGGDAVFV
jgi:hypothetical protein